MPDQPTEIYVRWSGFPHVQLRVTHNDPITAEDLRLVADVVERVEDFRSAVIDADVEEGARQEMVDG